MLKTAQVSNTFATRQTRHQCHQQCVICTYHPLFAYLSHTLCLPSIHLEPSGVRRRNEGSCAQRAKPGSPLSLSLQGHIRMTRTILSPQGERCLACPGRAAQAAKEVLMGGDLLAAFGVTHKAVRTGVLGINPMGVLGRVNSPHGTLEQQS